MFHARWATLAAVLAVVCTVNAHEVLPAAKYSGYVVEVNEIFFEVVPGPAQTMLYIEDDGRPVPSASMGGTMTLQTGGRTQIIRLAPAGQNRLVAQLQKPPRGTPIDIEVALSAAEKIAFRFVMR